MDTAMSRWPGPANVPKNVALQGNLDPEVLISGGAALKAEAESILAAMKGRPFIFNSRAMGLRS